MLPNALKMFMALGSGAACRPYTEPRRLCAARASSSHRQCIEWLDIVKQPQSEQQTMLKALSGCEPCEAAAGRAAAQTKRAAQELHGTKEHFIANVSHTARYRPTPATSQHGISISSLHTATSQCSRWQQQQHQPNVSWGRMLSPLLAPSASAHLRYVKLMCALVLQLHQLPANVSHTGGHRHTVF
jgi:hypothetical protein